MLTLMLMKDVNLSESLERKKSQNWLPWKEAQKEYRKLAKKHGLKGIGDLRQFSKTHRRELEKMNLPANPWRVYTKEKVWKRMKK